jgi:hypothetical protein
LGGTADNDGTAEEMGVKHGEIKCSKRFSSDKVRDSLEAEIGSNEF